ncbi:MAG: hypothetical protein WDN07_04865 [Actinomycetota bacterium]
MTNVEIYRPKSNLVFAGIGIVLCLFFVWSAFYQGGVTSEITSVLFTLFILDFIYIFLIHPKITFCDEGVVITNPTEEIVIGWADVRELEAKWAMAIETEKFTVSAWAATAPGRHQSRNIHINEVVGLGIELDGVIRPADSPRSDSGAATYRAKIRLEKFRRNNGSISLVTSRKRSWNKVLIGGVFLIVAILVNALGH